MAYIEILKFIALSNSKLKLLLFIQNYFTLA